MSLLETIGLKALHRLDPETAHNLTLKALKCGLGPVDPMPEDPILATRVLDLDFPSPVGLSAGFDKNAEVMSAMLRAGMGFVEVGSMLLGAGTLVHIFAYKKGGRFNPLFPLLFAGPALSGLLIFFQTLGAGSIFEGSKPIKLLGAGLCLGAGIFAVYTVGLAMTEAKKEGDAKKAAAAEARKAARAARRSQQKG